MAVKQNMAANAKTIDSCQVWNRETPRNPRSRKTSKLPKRTARTIIDLGELLQTNCARGQGQRSRWAGPGGEPLWGVSGHPRNFRLITNPAETRENRRLPRATQSANCNCVSRLKSIKRIPPATPADVPGSRLFIPSATVGQRWASTARDQISTGKSGSPPSARWSSPRYIRFSDRLQRSDIFRNRFPDWGWCKVSLIAVLKSSKVWTPPTRTLKSGRPQISAISLRTVRSLASGGWKK